MTQPFYIVEDCFKDCSEFIKSLTDIDKIIFITDYNLSSIYSDDIESFLKSINKEFLYKVIAAGENSKNIDHFVPLIEGLIADGVSRKSMLIAFGGGVVGDIVGFIASVLLRGIRYINIPTSLIAQIDSCIGGKTGFNSKFGKNLIGSFYLPVRVIISPKLLYTLSNDNYLSGYAEILKHAIIDGEKSLDYLEANIDAFLNKEYAYLKMMVEHSLSIKIQTINKDTLEQNGNRILLNLGHSFAHAIESYFANHCGNIKILHGEAVMVGIILAFEYSYMIGFLKGDDIISRLVTHMKKVTYDVIIKKIYDANIDISIFMSYFNRDKKNCDQNIMLILPKNLGDIRPVKVDGNNLKIFLQDRLSD